MEREKNLKEQVRKLACKYIKEHKLAKLEEIRKYIENKIGSYEYIEEGIKETCVNYCSRTYTTTVLNHNDYNCLFAINKSIGKNSQLEEYNPSKHGYWELDKATYKPYLKKLPDKANYLNWLREIYKDDWSKTKESLNKNIKDFRKKLKNLLKLIRSMKILTVSMLKNSLIFQTQVLVQKFLTFLN